MDRGNPAVAAGVDAMHPAVLRMIADTCRLAAAHGRWVGVFGGLASDPAALPILVVLGVTELSAVLGFVAEATEIVRGLTEIGRASCRERVCPSVDIFVFAVYFKKKKHLK